MNKKFILSTIDFYLITDSNLSKNGIFSDVENAINAGCKIIQYREKDKSTREMIEEASIIKKLCKKDTIFLVNDRIDVALAVDSDGVHLGQDDMSLSTARKLLGNDKIIGLSTHNYSHAIEAQKNGADYIGFGPIFYTSTKKDIDSVLGINSIDNIRNSINIPIVAIGGINKNNCAQIIKNGADSIVSISAVVSKNNVRLEVEEFIDIIKKTKTS